MAAVKLAQFMRNYKSYTDRQVEVMEVDEEESKWVRVKISPNAGPYRGGNYKFKINLDPMGLDSEDMFLHPNINMNGRVCVSYDEDNDDKADHALLALLFLLHSPEYDDPWGYWEEVDKENVYRTIRVALSGRPIANFESERFIEDDEEILQFVHDIEFEELYYNAIDEEYNAWCGLEAEEIKIRIDKEEQGWLLKWKEEYTYLERVKQEASEYEYNLWQEAEGEEFTTRIAAEAEYLRQWREECAFLKRVEQALDYEYNLWREVESEDVRIRIEAEADYLRQWNEDEVCCAFIELFGGLDCIAESGPAEKCTDFEMSNVDSQIGAHEQIGEIPTGRIQALQRQQSLNMAEQNRLTHEERGEIVGGIRAGLESMHLVSA